MPTISPAYVSRGIKNPYYILNLNTIQINTIYDKLKEIINIDENILDTDIKFKCVEEYEAIKSNNILFKENGNKLNYYFNVEYKKHATDIYFNVSKKVVLRHDGDNANRKNSTATSNVNEIMSLYFLYYGFKTVEDVIFEIKTLSEKNINSNILSGNGQAIPYKEIYELILKDETYENTILSSYHNANAIKQDIGSVNNINKLYWTYRIKLPGMNSKNTSDIIIELRDKTYVGYSIKQITNILKPNAVKPPAFNTNLVTFFKQLGDSKHINLVENILNYSWNSVLYKINNDELIDAVNKIVHIEKEPPSEQGSSAKKFAAVSNIFEEYNMNFYTEDFYYPYRNSIINNLIDYLQNKNNFIYFLNTIAVYTYRTQNQTLDIRIKLLVGSPTGSKITEISDNNELRRALTETNPNNIKNLNFVYNNKSQSFTCTFTHDGNNISFIATLRCRFGGLQGKSLYFSTNQIHININNKIHETINDNDNDNSSKIAIIYSGRFQPFHIGHYQTYEYIVNNVAKKLLNLTEKNVYICTSNVTDNGSIENKSPFNFNEKKIIINTMFGNNIIVEKVINPYKPIEVLDKYNFNPEQDKLILVVGKKDSERFKSSYFVNIPANINANNIHKYVNKPLSEAAYIFIMPFEPELHIFNKRISGTTLRNTFTNPYLSIDDKKDIFVNIYKKFNQKIFDLLMLKLGDDFANSKIGFDLTNDKKQINIPKNTIIKNILTNNIYDDNTKKYIIQQVLKHRNISFNNKAYEELLKNIQTTSTNETTTLDNVSVFPPSPYAFSKKVKKPTKYIGMGWKYFTDIATNEVLKEAPHIKTHLDDKHFEQNKNLSLYIDFNFEQYKTSQENKKLYFNTWYTKHKIAAYLPTKNKYIIFNGDIIELSDTKPTNIVILPNEWYTHIVIKDNTNNRDKRIITKFINENTDKYTKFNFKNLKLNEGGAYGHLNHLYDDDDLTFGEIKNIFSMSLSGEISTKLNSEIKTDGQNLMISYKDGKVIAARNKSHLKNAGKNALDFNGVAEKFKDRGVITEAFVKAMQSLEKYFSNMNKNKLNTYFNNGSTFASIEIIYPKTKNVIEYGFASIIFHTLISYDETGEAIGENRNLARNFEKEIITINKNNFEEFEIKELPKAIIDKDIKFDSKLQNYIGKLNDILKQHKLNDSSTILDYKISSLQKIILSYNNNELSTIINNNSTLLEIITVNIIPILVNKIIGNDKTNINTLLTKFKTDLNEFDEKTVNKVIEFIKNINSSNVKTKIIKDSIWNIELLIYEFSIEVLNNLQSFLVLNKDNTIKDIKKQIDDVLETAKHKPEYKDKIQQILSKINSMPGGLNNLIPEEGITFTYNGKLYKFTGLFAPVNTLLGLLKYS